MDSVKGQLSNDEIGRYSRQMILPEFGINGQTKLKSSSVLIVGVGGLGCPAAMYLASAGIGRLGLVDYDVVELNNLHRQVLHNESTLGLPKAQSAKTFIKNMNSSVEVEIIEEAFTADNALDIVKKYNVVLDCTDNVATRYLINDACIFAKVPLISGSALRFEGQLTTYNYKDGPCYRCLFPVPPPSEFVTNCSDGGVLGPIPGTIGTLQALEAIKLLSEIGPSYVGRMLIFDGLQGTFSDVKIRPKQSNCSICGDHPVIDSLKNDYPTFCGSSFDDKDRPVQILKPEERISPAAYNALAKQNDIPFVLIDVREPQELEICTIPDVSMNIPYSSMYSDKSIETLKRFLRERVKLAKAVQNVSDLEVFVVCRRGNDSQRAVKLLKEKCTDLDVIIKDIEGGLHAWARDVDKSFPIY